MTADTWVIADGDDGDIELQRREQAAAAAIKAGLNLVACGQRDGQCTYNLVDSRGKRKRRVHVGLTLDEVLGVLEPAADGKDGAQAAGTAEPVTTDVVDQVDATIVEEESAAQPYQVMPPLDPEDFATLRESIKKEGMLLPVIVDGAGNILDGHHRAAIAHQLGRQYDTVVRKGLTPAQKRSLAYTLNIARRQLTRAQVRDLIAKSLKADPQLSDREHGRRTGVSPTTVGTVRGKLEQTGDVSKLDTRTDSTGREQPASKPVIEPEPELGPPAAPIEAAEPTEGNTLPLDDEPALGAFGLAFGETAKLHVFFTYGVQTVSVKFGDPLPEQITPTVAAELAERVRAVVPEIIKLGVQLERRGREGGP